MRLLGKLAAAGLASFVLYLMIATWLTALGRHQPSVLGTQTAVPIVAKSEDRKARRADQQEGTVTVLVAGQDYLIRIGMPDFQHFVVGRSVDVVRYDAWRPYAGYYLVDRPGHVYFSGSYMIPVVTGPGVDEMLAHQLVQTQHIVELTVEQQTAVGADLRAVKLDANPAIKIQPSALRLAFTRKVRHRRLPPMLSMC